MSVLQPVLPCPNHSPSAPWAASLPRQEEEKRGGGGGDKEEREIKGEKKTWKQKSSRNKRTTNISMDGLCLFADMDGKRGKHRRLTCSTLFDLFPVECTCEGRTDSMTGCRRRGVEFWCTVLFYQARLSLERRERRSLSSSSGVIIYLLGGQRVHAVPWYYTVQDNRFITRMLNIWSLDQNRPFRRFTLWEE